MFDKIKKIKELRDQAKSIQEVLSTITVTEGQSDKLQITMDGNMEIREVLVRKEAFASDEDLQEEMRSVLNRTIKESQKKAAEIMRTSGMFNIPG
jgi:DNA-binding protein YbaB